MNRAFFSEVTDFHEQNQYAGCILPLKNNFLQMKPGRRFFVMLTGLVNNKLPVIMVAHTNVRKSQKKILKKVDVFAEPLSERFNEFMDIIAVSFDKAKEAVFGTIEQNRTKTVETTVKVKTTPGRYARVKV